uniref:Uncharacterized protein n=1 Tax=Arundo donax TaxID=35708 RepID=A0A0A8YPB1_ARUDO
MTECTSFQLEVNSML